MNDEKDKASKVLVPPPPPPSIPLEPPPPHNMEEFLKNAGQQVFCSNISGLEVIFFGCWDLNGQ